MLCIGREDGWWSIGSDGLHVGSILYVSGGQKAEISRHMFMNPEFLNTGESGELWKCPPSGEPRLSIRHHAAFVAA